MSTREADTATLGPIGRRPLAMTIADQAGPLLAGRGSDLAQHRRLYGDMPAHDGTALARLLDESGLTGRGGGGFPTGTKLRTVLAQRRRPVVIANGSEGEPLSAKDCTLLTVNPHLVIDGVLAVAQATHAAEVVIVVHDAQAGILRRALGGRPDAARITVTSAGDRFISGEASAVASRVEGGDGLPFDRTRPIAQEGPGRRPLFVGNVETFADIALIARFGAGWFRRLGGGEPGTRLVTVTGDVGHRCVAELPVGEPVGRIIETAGGAPRGSVALVGGFSGGWIGETDWDVAHDDSALSAYGARVGAGIVHVIGPARCPLRFGGSVLAFLAAQSAGQCGPCLFGLPALSAAFDRVVHGVAGPHVQQRVGDLAAAVDHRGMCHHPDGAAAFARATLAAFPDEIIRHRNGRCHRP